MRLWHKDLISVLPDKQLLGQWRECCAIAKDVYVKGSPNHILVNKIHDYPLSHFWSYGIQVAVEMYNRGFKVDVEKFNKYFPFGGYNSVLSNIFDGWHDNRYLTQCYYNLQEKYDCEGISIEEWVKISKKYNELKSIPKMVVCNERF